MILVINLNFQDDQFTLVIQSSGSIDNPFLSGAILAVAQNGPRPEVVPNWQSSRIWNVVLVFLDILSIYKIEGYELIGCFGTGLAFYCQSTCKFGSGLVACADRFQGELV